MPNENEILPLQSDFEQIKKTSADGSFFGVPGNFLLH